MREITPGTVLEVENSNIFINNDYEVIISGLYVGTLKGNLKWFEESKAPAPKEIKEIVYISRGVFGYKHLHKIVDEFAKLDEWTQEDILLKFRNFD